MRRILAFHIVSQIGYLLLGIALMSPAGAAATLYFTAHNILAKAGLFLIAGIVWRLAGHHDLRRVGGLYAARPGLALLFLLAAFSLVGVPPTSGFWGKFLLVRESFGQGQFLWGGVALAVIAAMPEAKACPERPPSIEARFSSSAKRVGFCTRAYSKPLCLPSSSWT